MKDTDNDVFIQLKYRIVVDKDGTRCYYNAVGQLHCEEDPAVEYTDGAKCWYQHGKLHREPGPAIVTPLGSAGWYQNGVLHREDCPALEHYHVGKEWHIFGKRYTEDKYWSELSEAQWQR